MLEHSVDFSPFLFLSSSSLFFFSFLLSQPNYHIWESVTARSHGSVKTPQV